MGNEKPAASLSLDLDNLWSYLKTHGDLGWEFFPTYLDNVVPRVLEFLDQRKLKITFFIVGQDAALPINAAAIRSIVDAGHEVGNHSFSHEPWLHLYTEQQIEEELTRAEEKIQAVTGQKPVGFRGPGYSLSISVLRVLSRRGYLFDASTLPTFLGPLARAYYFMTTKLSKKDRETRKLLFGRLQDGLRPLRPYRWHLEGFDNGLIEIPVTTMPLFRIPFHISYILYISRFSPFLALVYFRFAVALCKLTQTKPSLLLHPLDFLGPEDVKELAFFPAMNLSAAKKMKIVSDVLKIYTDNFNVLPMGEFAQMIGKAENTVTKDPVLVL